MMRSRPHDRFHLFLLEALFRKTALMMRLSRLTRTADKFCKPFHFYEAFERLRLTPGIRHDFSAHAPSFPSLEELKLCELPFRNLKSTARELLEVCLPMWL